MGVHGRERTREWVEGEGGKRVSAIRSSRLGERGVGHVTRGRTKDHEGANQKE